jgi:hypothetical protein
MSAAGRSYRSVAGHQTPQKINFKGVHQTAVGSNSRASSSGVRPDRVNSSFSRTL